MNCPSLLVLEHWMEYRKQVIDIYTDFFILLSTAHPDLTNREVKLCALLLFECENSEIVSSLEMSLEAVLTAKHRLRKKFRLKMGVRIRAHLLFIAAGNYMPPPPGKILVHFVSR
jgi:DNA-binding CsgD family transcriptional regulator